MHSHYALIRRFYGHLAAADAQGAAACYHPDVLFSEPLFPSLRGEAAAELLRLRLAPGTRREVRLLEASSDEHGATARWSAREVVRGRTVLIEGRSMFAFRDGLIARHYDHYPLWRWIAQALGPAGAALGWFGPFRWAVRRRAARALERFSAARD